MSSKKNSILESECDIEPIVCEACGIKAPKIYIIGVLFYCIECAEGKLRRDRFEREEEEWNRVDIE